MFPGAAAPASEQSVVTTRESLAWVKTCGILTTVQNVLSNTLKHVQNLVKTCGLTPLSASEQTLQSSVKGTKNKSRRWHSSRGTVPPPSAILLFSGPVLKTMMAATSPSTRRPVGLREEGTLSTACFVFFSFSLALSPSLPEKDKAKRRQPNRTAIALRKEEEFSSRIMTDINPQQKTCLPCPPFPLLPSVPAAPWPFSCDDQRLTLAATPSASRGLRTFRADKGYANPRVP